METTDRRRIQRSMSFRHVCTFFLCLVATTFCVAAENPTPESRDVFRRSNLVAWCIVPFDAKKRGPEERAAMLEKIGIKRLAYDYRAEHVPTFDAEILALQKHKIELTAWWFPSTLNADARNILDVLKRHDLKPQLWITGGGVATQTSE